MEPKEIKFKCKACTDSRKKSADKKKWHKPELEDVSGKVMAQPYIRFT